MSEDKRICIALNKNGEPCKALAISNSDFCWSHAPELEDVREDARKNGGRKRQYINVSGERIKIEKIDDIQELVEEAISNLRQMDISVAQTRALLTALDTAFKIYEYREILPRLQNLEDKMENNK